MTPHTGSQSQQNALSLPLVPIIFIFADVTPVLLEPTSRPALAADGQPSVQLDHFHPAILGSAVVGVIRGGGRHHADAGCAQPLRIDPVVCRTFTTASARRRDRSRLWSNVP